VRGALQPLGANQNNQNNKGLFERLGMQIGLFVAFKNFVDAKWMHFQHLHLFCV
jgi:hypothetical protein